MKLLDHIKTDTGYTVRIWLDEIAPNCIQEYTWAPYKSDESGWNFTEEQYQQQQLDQANKLATQTLAQLNPTPTVVSQDTTAIQAQQDALRDTLDAQNEESDA